MEDAGRRSFALIASVGVTALLLSIATKAYFWFADYDENHPRPAVETSQEPDPAPGIWSEVAKDLQGAESLTIYSLMPSPVESPAEAGGLPVFHQYPVLGTAAVKSPERFASVVSRLVQGIHFGGGWAMCFLPRHGVQATLRDGRRIDLVICYQCDRIEVYGARQSIHVHPGPSKQTLDDVLRTAGVDLKDPRLHLELDR